MVRQRRFLRGLFYWARFVNQRARHFADSQKLAFGSQAQEIRNDVLNEHFPKDADSFRLNDPATFSRIFSSALVFLSADQRRYRKLALGDGYQERGASSGADCIHLRGVFYGMAAAVFSCTNSIDGFQYFSVLFTGFITGDA